MDRGTLEMRMLNYRGGHIIWSLLFICFSCHTNKNTSKGEFLQLTKKQFATVKSCKNDDIRSLQFIAKIAFDAIYKVTTVDSVGNLIDEEFVKLTVFNEKNKESLQYRTEWSTVKKLNKTFVETRESFGSFSGSDIDSLSVFVHPIRVGKFAYLELAPFPYIFFNKHYWQYNVKVGEQWSINKLNWKGNLILNNEYYLIGIQTININGKDEKCYEVFSTSSSDLTKSQLYFLYSNDYGFVKLRYYNIDMSITTFNMIQ